VLPLGSRLVGRAHLTTKSEESLRSMISNRQALLLLATIIFCFTLAPFTGLVNLGPSFSSTLLHKENIIPQLATNGMLLIESSTEHVPACNLVTTNKDRFKTLGIASDIFVLSLPRRTDRHTEMEVLRIALNLQWTFVDAVESHSTAIESIMTQMRSLRAGSATASTSTDRGIFRWPQNIDALSSSSQPLGLEGSDLWASQSSTYNNKRHLKATTIRGIAGITDKSTAIPTTSAEPLTCTSEDYNILPFTRGLPEYKLLTMAKMACWNSHLSIIRRIAEGNSRTQVALEQDVSLILEDDIDMECDIRERLASIWTLIPAGWDMVFLGA
jgi:hypothetical protein